MWNHLDDDDEPVITLLTGTVVTRAVFDLVRQLQATGHTIRVDEDSSVRVTPPISADSWFVLDSNWQDVKALLAADSQDAPLRRTMPTAATVH